MIPVPLGQRDQPGLDEILEVDAGAAGPGVLTQTHLFFVGGDDGSQYGHPYETHTGLARRILVMDLESLEVTDVGEWPHPVAVAPLLRLGDDLVDTLIPDRGRVRFPRLFG